MGKPIVREFGQYKTILKFFDFKAATCMVPTTLAGDDGIVKAGTPFPANDATCKGYILEEVDVSNGAAPGAYVYEGALDTAKLTANGITVTANAKGATPRVTFF